MVRGLMSDETWAIFELFLTTASARGRRPPGNHRRIGWRFLDCPHGCAVARSAGGVWQLELDLAAIPALERQWRVGCLLQALADSGGEADRLQMIDSATTRAHRCAAGLKGGRTIRRLGAHAEAFQPKSTSAPNRMAFPSRRS